MERLKYRQLYSDEELGEDGDRRNDTFEYADCAMAVRRAHEQRTKRSESLPDGRRSSRSTDLTSQSRQRQHRFPVQFRGQEFRSGTGHDWKTDRSGMERLVKADRLDRSRQHASISCSFLDDFPVLPIDNICGRYTSIADSRTTRSMSFRRSAQSFERCILMTTDPGDLVLDPTCGSGTTA